MPISKGSGYGRPGAEPPPDLVRCSGDAAARAVVEAARRDGRPPPPLGLLGGDLARTLGGGGQLDVAFPVDLGQVLLDGRLHLFVAHLVARDRWWGEVLAVGNAQWLGAWNPWPKGHPGDGRLDVLEARLPPRQRLAARRRLPAGAHLPHPGIRERRVQAATFEPSRPLEVWLDGERVGRASVLAVRCEPDALLVHV